MPQSTLRAITTDSLNRLVAVMDSVSSQDQRLTALESQVASLGQSVALLTSAIETLGGTITTLNDSVAQLLSDQTQHEQIISSLQVVGQAASDLQSSLLQLRESVG